MTRNPINFSDSAPGVNLIQPQSKHSYNFEDDSLDDCHADLRAAIKRELENSVSRARLDLESCDIKDLRSIVEGKLKSEGGRNTVIGNILEEFRAIAKSGKGSTASENDVKVQIESHVDVILDHFNTSIVQAVEADRDSASHGTPQQQRRVVTRTLKLIKRKATCYELLGVKQDAQHTDIITAHRSLVRFLHPDKNKDEAADECAKAINVARDVLIDRKKREKYDFFLKNNPVPPGEGDLFGEEFAANAYDPDDSDDRMEDYSEVDSEEDDEKNYPDPSKEVLKRHRAIGEIVRIFFKNLDGPINAAKLQESLGVHNMAIQNDNIKHRRPNIDMFKVPYDKLLACQYTQRRIVMAYTVGMTEPQQAQKEIQALVTYFEKTRQRGVYQWPAAWTGFLMIPLQKQLVKLGLPVDKIESKPPDNRDTVGGTKLEPQEKLDTEMPDVEVDDSGRPKQQPKPTHTQKELRILAHSSSIRHGTRSMGFSGMKYFFDIEGLNRLQVKMADEVESEEAIKYHSSKKKTNIREKELTYRMLDPADLIGIEGVAFLPETGSNERTCWTYIRARMRNISDHIPVMTRTTLRDWQGKKKADKMIDDFLVASNNVPPWAMVNNDPKKHLSYIPLTYPLPTPKKSRRNAQTAFKRRSDDDDEDEDEDEDGRLLINRTSHYQNGAIQELTNKMDNVINMFNAYFEEERKHREQNNEMLKRLLPSPP